MVLNSNKNSWAKAQTQHQHLWTSSPTDWFCTPAPLTLPSCRKRPGETWKMETFCHSTEIKVWHTGFLSLKNLSGVRRSWKSQSSKNPSCTEERKFSFFSPNNNKKIQTNQELNVSPVKLTLQAGSPWRWVLSLQHKVTPCKAMHTGKNNPNYIHDMTGFSSAVIKQKPSDSVCAHTFRVASSALQQSKRQEEHF